jgi:signal transduction histidine kinase
VAELSAKESVTMLLRLWPHLLRRTFRVRLALSYWGLFLASAVALLLVTVALWQGATKSTVHVPGSGAGSSLPAAVNAAHASGVVQHSSDLQQLLIVSGIALAIMAVVTFVFGWLVAGRFLRPMRTITATAKEISASNLHKRVNLAGPDDELKEMADTFDELLARLERSFQFERRFVANASHELRTPLATMRVWLDVAIAKPGPLPAQTVALADRLRNELDRMDRLLESFLTLAHAQQGPAADESTLSLGEIATAALEQRADAIARLGLKVDQNVCPDTWIKGSETLLCRMVENVIDNAVTHNEAGGWIRVTTEVERPLARIVVENGGAVLAEDDVDQLARPFRRLGAERTGSDKGTGLGLSIVAAITEVHGGTLDLYARSDGGLRVVIALPLAAGIVVGAQA